MYSYDFYYVHLIKYYYYFFAIHFLKIKAFNPSPLEQFYQIEHYVYKETYFFPFLKGFFTLKVYITIISELMIVFLQIAANSTMLMELISILRSTNSNKNLLFLITDLLFPFSLLTCIIILLYLIQNFFHLL